MTKENIWNVPMERAVEYFREQEDVTEERTNVFLFRSCRIVLKAQRPSRMGIWSSDRISIRMEGEEADIETIHHRFFLRFLSLG